VERTGLKCGGSYGRVRGMIETKNGENTILKDRRTDKVDGMMKVCD
jgi:hypothetical protein